MTEHESERRDAIAEANRTAWNATAAKYAPDVEADVRAIRDGRVNLLPAELQILRPVLPEVRRALHLMCSHGQDALSLWALGVPQVVGLDLSDEMLALARRKTELLGAPATWHHADALEPPPDLDGSFDLVYTGRGAVPWVTDLARWAGVVERLLAPGGRLYLFEGHPFNCVWDDEADDVRVRPGADYFARDPRENSGFPASYLERIASPGEAAPRAYEMQWTLGDAVSALAGAGLRLELLREHPEHFWPEFPKVPGEALGRVPHTYSLLMRKPAG